MNLIELIREHLEGQPAEQLGQQVNLAPDKARAAVESLWPLQLDALTGRAQTLSGAEQLLDLARSVPGGSVTQLLARPGALGELQKQGAGLSSTLLGSDEGVIADRVAAHVGAPQEAVAGLGKLTLPLILKLLSEHVGGSRLGAAGLGAMLLGLRPQLTALLPAGLSGLIGSVGGSAVNLGKAGLGGVGAAAAGTLAAGGAAASTVAGGLASGTANAARSSVPATPQPVPVQTVPVQPTPVQPQPQRRGAGWLWAIPLALLLLAGGCYLANQNRMAAGSTASGTTENGMAGAGNLAVTDPAAGTTLPAAAFTMRGTGTAGQTLSILDGGTQIGTATVEAGGNWSFEVPAPSQGAHTYEVRGPDAAAPPAQLAVTVGAAGNAATNTTTNSATGTDANTAATTPDTSGAATTGEALAISTPATGGSVPAGAFDLSGTGTAGQEVELFEDGNSIGKVVVGADGNWTLNVPSPAAGQHTYEVRSQGQTASSAVTVGTASADASAAACTQDFSVSLKDGQSVTAPFRFGGQGTGQSYTITVLRGERTVGTKRLPLSADCGWSYSSNPGKGEVTYVVRPGQDASAAPVSTLTLNVQ